MKVTGKLGLSLISLALWGWLAACAGTGDMMDQEMASDTNGQMESGMDHKMDAGMEANMESGMHHKMDAGMEHEMNTGMASKMDSEMGAMLMGSGNHHASGMVAFGMGMHDTRTLIIRNLKVDKVPDGYVYLAKNGDRMHGVELGKLQQFSGTVTFDLPTGINPEDYDSVIIWCKQFNVEIGRAHLANSSHGGM